MPASVTDLLRKQSDGANYPNVATVSSPRATGNTTLVCDDLTGWPSDTGVDFITFRLDTNNAVVSGSQTTWVAVKSGSSLINLTRIKGAVDAGNSIGDKVMVIPSSEHTDDLIAALLTSHDQTGALLPAAVRTALNIGTTPADYTALATTPTTITNNGNRSYTLLYPDVNYTDRLSPGTRLRTTRTVAAPTQSTSLNGTNQYFSKTSPAGMTFTDDFTVSAWVKLSSYSNSMIATRWNGTSGWRLGLTASGQIFLEGYNASVSNYRGVLSYQSLPLNKWVHVSAQLDMSAHTATTTTSYTMLDGTDVPASVYQNGTNPTALIQAGNLEVGSANGGLTPFPGKIAQVAIFNAKVTQATMRGYISQGLTGSETSLISAFSFNNTLNDLNTTNANNLTANGGAVATNADSPFGGQAGGTISSTVDYGIIQAVSYSSPNTTVTVQVPEGCTIPTSGGVSATSYSGVKAPYGFPASKDKWIVSSVILSGQSVSVSGTGSWIDSTWKLTIPLGSWIIGWSGSPYLQSTGGGNMNQNFGIYNGTYRDTDYVVNCYSANSTVDMAPTTKEKPDTLTAATTYTFSGYTISVGAGTVTYASNSLSLLIYAKNAYL